MQARECILTARLLTVGRWGACCTMRCLSSVADQADLSSSLTGTAPGFIKTDSSGARWSRFAQSCRSCFTRTSDGRVSLRKQATRRRSRRLDVVAGKALSSALDMAGVIEGLFGRWSVRRHRHRRRHHGNRPSPTPMSPPSPSEPSGNNSTQRECRSTAVSLTGADLRTGVFPKNHAYAVLVAGDEVTAGFGRLLGRRALCHTLATD